MPSPLVAVNYTDQPTGPVMSRVRVFPFQSYFDTALLSTALLPQPTNSEGFVQSTIAEEQVPGYGIALHPDSECPVAVQVRGGAGGDSGTFILRPGQVLRPTGLDGGAFDGFRWGLPFGWLGGGVAHLLVLLTPDSRVDFSGAAEVIFHRVRVPVLDAGVALLTDANWPRRFPWPDAVATLGGVLVDQRGDPLIAPVPTRVALRLRKDNLAAPAAMRIIWTGTDDFDLGTITGAVLGADLTYVDVNWPAITPSPPAAFPLLTLQSPEVRLGGDLCTVNFVDLTGGDLTGTYVDVVRYGRI